MSQLEKDPSLSENKLSLSENKMSRLEKDPSLLKNKLSLPKNKISLAKIGKWSRILRSRSRTSKSERKILESDRKLLRSDKKFFKNGRKLLKSHRKVFKCHSQSRRNNSSRPYKSNDPKSYRKNRAAIGRNPQPCFFHVTIGLNSVLRRVDIGQQRVHR